MASHAFRPALPPREAPILQSGRLTLRPLSRADWPAFRDFHASDASGPVGGPIDAKGAWSLFAAGAGSWMLDGHGWLAVDDGQGIAGLVGLLFPPHHHEPEIAWITFPHARRRGYAAESARTLLDWAWHETDRPRLVSYIEPGNAPSKAVARRLGAVDTSAAATHDPDCTIWAHERPAA